MSDEILYQMAGRTATITLNRPQLKNALNQAALDAPTARIAEAASDDDVWLLVIRAAGKDFCTGQDLADKGNQGDYFEPVFRALKSSAFVEKRKPSWRAR